MAQTLSNYDAVLKEDYEGDIRETLNNEIRLFSLLEETDAETQGRRLVMPIHLARNSGTGARAEGADLPTAGNQGYQDAFAKAKYNYTRIQITVQTIKASRNNMGAFTRALKSELKGAITDLKVEMNYQSFNDGSGARAQNRTARQNLSERKAHAMPRTAGTSCHLWRHRIR